jgi:hypothetical protein
MICGKRFVTTPALVRHPSNTSTKFFSIAERFPLLLLVGEDTKENPVEQHEKQGIPYSNSQPIKDATREAEPPSMLIHALQHSVIDAFNNGEEQTIYQTDKDSLEKLLTRDQSSYILKAGYILRSVQSATHL